jgi:putative N6-adenine-specific DNA methylase
MEDPERRSTPDASWATTPLRVHCPVVKKETVGRGGLKLEAALELFGLASVVRGGQAVDVGASTGGFTEALLRHGAKKVTAVDVGHGQLHETLRQDARVESLEGTNWKTLSLTVAPGPFDFFTVDVSFVAARNMLRGLAFRLRAGAQGVVLVKPQFELPDHLVKGGDVSDPALRARALESFRKKAGELGFTLVAHHDSPVAGGSGTVEILAHLRFDGRSERLPQPGERKPVVPRRDTGRAVGVKRLTKAGPLSWFAVAAPGLEEAVHAELALLEGAQQVTRVDGGVTFSGPLEAGMRANLWSRVATRVLLRLGEVESRQFAELRRRLAKLPWEDFVPPGRPLRIDAAVSRCRLYHTGALAETVALAVADRVGPLPEATGDEDESATRVLLRGREDRFVVSVDSSGELLHRRGWRLETGRAPLRETLAAGLLWLCGHDPARPFVDPMCGAGTIALEACALALGVAPGLARSFAFERWPGFDAARWASLRDQALAAIRPSPPAPLYAFDRDAEAVDITRRNAGRAGFLAHLQVERGELGERPAPAPSGLVLLNPPYGRRIGSSGRGRDLGRVLRTTYPGWTAGVLLPAADRAGLGLTSRATHALSNGGVRVSLVVTDISLPGARRALN